MKIEEKGRLVEVNLRSGIITASIHEGMFKDRLIRLIIDTDQEFVQKMGHLLEVKFGQRLDYIRHLKGKSVEEHEITIIIK